MLHVHTIYTVWSKSCCIHVTSFLIYQVRTFLVQFSLHIELIKYYDCVCRGRNNRIREFNANV